MRRNDELIDIAFVPPEIKELRAGDLTMEYEDGFLRNIFYGETEIIRMIYFALRDQKWNTIALHILNEELHIGKEQFRVSYDAHQFWMGKRIITWKGQMEGFADSRLVFSINGTFDEPFLKNRAGLCVLHPIEEVLNQSCKVTHPDGRTTTGNFPIYISPHQPFKDIQKLEWKTIHGINANLNFHGEIFEMEDQRNWTDASFKTYCTPLVLPFPVQMNPGDVIRQKVELRIQHETELTPKIRLQKSKEVPLIPEVTPLFPFPEIGSCIPLEHIPLTGESVERITGLQLNHLKADVALTDAHWVARMEYCLRFFREASIPLQWCLYFGSDPGREWEGFKDYCLDHAIPVTVISILSLESPATPDSVLSFLPEKMKADFPGVKTGFGTSFYFTELNRNRPQKWSGLDFVVFSNSPQVHAFDLRSMVETFTGQEATVESCRQFVPGVPVHVSPVSLFPRFRQKSSESNSGPLTHAHPADKRQYSLFTAGWTLGCISALARQMVALIDFYEVWGSRGLCEATTVSPVYLLLKWLQSQSDRHYFNISDNKPRDISALGLECSAGRFMLLSNHTWKEQKVRIQSPDLMLKWSMDESTLQSQLRSGEISNVDTPIGKTEIILGPFALMAFTSK